MLTLTIKETRGVCRWCGCTEFEPCEGGCGWANGTGTLCTVCVNFDRLVKTVSGRRQLVAILNDWQDDVRGHHSKPQRLAIAARRRA